VFLEEPVSLHVTLAFSRRQSQRAYRAIKNPRSIVVAVGWVPFRLTPTQRSGVLSEEMCRSPCIAIDFACQDNIFLLMKNLLIVAIGYSGRSAPLPRAMGMKRDVGLFPPPGGGYSLVYMHRFPHGNRTIESDEWCDYKRLRVRDGLGTRAGIERAFSAWRTGNK